jgi:phospholipase D
MRYAGTIGSIILALVVLGATGSHAAGRRNAQSVSPAAIQPHGPVVARVSVCFVPEQECDLAIVEAIAGAKESIRVQAYGFTSQPILQALAEAHSRGVDVQAILDKTDDPAERAGGKTHPGGARFTASASIPTWIDDSVAIAHNKVIVIDGHLVVGGSYNYTARAERRNAENVTFIDSSGLADLYLANWEARKAMSRPSSYQYAEH